MPKSKGECIQLSGYCPICEGQLSASLVAYKDIYKGKEYIVCSLCNSQLETISLVKSFERALGFRKD